MSHHADHAVMIHFNPDGRAVLYVLHSPNPRELARRLQKIAAHLIENPSAAPRLTGAVEEAATWPR